MDSSLYEVEVTYPEPPDIIIRSNLDSMDDLTFSDSLLFKYEVEIDTGTFYLADIYIDNTLIYRSDTIRDSIWIVPTANAAEGAYQLDLRAYAKTFSGSLADQLDAESFFADSSWVIILNYE